jgi:hypothetical protein
MNQDRVAKQIKFDTEGEKAVAELNARLKAAGIDPTTLAFFWCCSLASLWGPPKGWIVASGLVIKKKMRRVRPGEVEALIERAKRVQAQAKA